MSPAKQQVFRSIALVSLVATLALGCGAKSTPTVPGGELSTTQVHTGEGSGTQVTMEAVTAVPTATPGSEQESMTPTPSPESVDVEVAIEAEPIIRLAQKDLALRLGLAQEAIRLVSLEAVEWRDASLGCPQPGMMYAQVITPGFRVVLEAEGRTYEYHTDAAESVMLCGADGSYVDPVPLMPMFPHGKPSPKPRDSAH